MTASTCSSAPGVTSSRNFRVASRWPGAIGRKLDGEVLTGQTSREIRRWTELHEEKEPGHLFRDFFEDWRQRHKLVRKGRQLVDHQIDSNPEPAPVAY